MPTITTAHNPGLTVEQVQDVIARELSGRYDVHSTTFVEGWLSGRPDIVVRKNMWKAVGIGLRHQPPRAYGEHAGTFFDVEGMEPPVVYLGLLGALVGILFTYGVAWLLLSSSWEAMGRDVVSVIENASELH